MANLPFFATRVCMPMACKIASITSILVWLSSASKIKGSEAEISGSADNGKLLSVGEESMVLDGDNAGIFSTECSISPART